jgi:hypothetical protein
MLSVLAVTVITERHLMDRWVAWLLLAAAAAAAQVIVAVVWPPVSVGFSSWQHAVFG